MTSALRFSCLMAFTLSLILTSGIAHAAQDAKSVTVMADSATPPPEPTLPTTLPAAPTNMTLPKWSEFPVAPTGVPTAAEIKVRVNKALDRASVLQTIGQSIVWDENDPDAFAAAALVRMNLSMAQPVTVIQEPEIDALAAKLRQEVTPPPIAH